MDDIPDTLRLRVDHEIGLFRTLVRIVDAGEAFDLAPPRFRVHAPLIRLLRILQGRRDVDEEETPVLTDRVPRLLTTVFERRDGRGDDGGAGFGEFGGDESDALDVFVAVFAGKAEFGGEFGADGVAQEEGDGAAALLVEGDLEGAGDGVLAGVLVAGEKDGEALGEAGRVRLPEHFDDFGVGEPFRDVFAGAEPVAEFGAADVEGSDAGWDFVFGTVLVAVGEVGHHLEWDDFDAEFVSVFLNGVLSVVRAVELFAFGILARTRVIPSHDEMCSTVVLPDDSVPYRFSRSTHTHG